jgi:glycosyltransferase involved in cell wall biosynthesis
MRNYSIVVPLHNEEENVTALYARLKQVMEQIGGTFELVLVDDGSTDRTYHLLKEIAAVDSRVSDARGLGLCQPDHEGRTTLLAGQSDEAVYQAGHQGERHLQEHRLAHLPPHLRHTAEGQTGKM